MCHLLYYCLYFQRRGAEPRRFLRSFQLTLSCEVADNHSASRGCDYGAKKAFRGLPLGHPCLMRGARTPLATEEKRAFRGLPLGNPCPMRGARTPLATEGKRPSGWEILCELWRARSLALAPFVRPCGLTEGQWLCLRVLSISPEPLRLGASALKKE